MADPQAQPKKVFCVRNQILKDPAEHLCCPYCFGRVRHVIECGERKEFCDFNPEKDPIAFGFPEDSTRNLRG